MFEVVGTCGIVLSCWQDHALVQFQTPAASQSALMHLRGFTLLGRSMEISFSKYMYISIRPGSAERYEME